MKRGMRGLCTASHSTLGLLPHGRNGSLGWRGGEAAKACYSTPFNPCASHPMPPHTAFLATLFPGLRLELCAPSSPSPPPPISPPPHTHVLFSCRSQAPAWSRPRTLLSAAEPPPPAHALLPEGRGGGNRKGGDGKGGRVSPRPAHALLPERRGGGTGRGGDRREDETPSLRYNSCAWTREEGRAGGVKGWDGTHI